MTKYFGSLRLSIWSAFVDEDDDDDVVVKREELMAALMSSSCMVEYMSEYIEFRPKKSVLMGARLDLLGLFCPFAEVFCLFRLLWLASFSSFCCLFLSSFTS
jgi:hypothetical protein